MAGFLDKRAPGIKAEYSRFMDRDILGKMLFKSLMIHMFGVLDSMLYIPLARHGDMDSYRDLPSDALVRVGHRSLLVEIKCAYVSTSHRTRPHPLQTWAFSRLLRTKQGRPKRYDILFAAGVFTPGLEDHGYWEHLESLRDRHHLASGDFRIDTLPHQPGFLSRCGFFFIPFDAIRTNDIRQTISCIPKQRYRDYFAWGYDRTRCTTIWRSATRHARG